MLADFECDVSQTVGRLDSAIAAARSAEVDMAFVDLNLRGVSARPVAEILRERRIPFAFVTGYGSAGSDPADVGVPVLQKPFRSQDLAAIIELLRH